MEKSFTIPADPLDRPARLDGFLAARRFNRSMIARELGVTPAVVTRLFNEEVCPKGQVHHLLTLVRAGIPKELLPPPPGGWPEDFPVVPASSGQPAMLNV